MMPPWPNEMFRSMTATFAAPRRARAGPGRRGTDGTAAAWRAPRARRAARRRSTTPGPSRPSCPIVTDEVGVRIGVAVSRGCRRPNRSWYSTAARVATAMASSMASLHPRAQFHVRVVGRQAAEGVRLAGSRDVYGGLNGGRYASTSGLLGTDTGSLVCDRKNASRHTIAGISTSLGDAERLDDRVEHLLVVLAVVLDPAGVALRQAVALVGEDVPGRSERAVDVGQHDRQRAAGAPVQHLVHVERARATRSR
jgi:hypothetical protein